MRVCYAVSSRAHVASNRVAFNEATSDLHRHGISRPTKLLEHARREAERRRIVFRIPPGLSAGSRTRRRGDPQVSGGASGLLHPGHLPPPSESRQIQRQHRRTDSHSGRRAGRRRARGGHRNRKRRERSRAWKHCAARASCCSPITITTARRRPKLVFRRMLRIPADGYKIVTTARKPSDNSRILALTQIASPHAADRAGDGRNRISHARAVAPPGAACSPTPRPMLPKAPLPAR